MRTKVPAIKKPRVKLAGPKTPKLGKVKNSGASMHSILKKLLT